MTLRIKRLSDVVIAVMVLFISIPILIAVYLAILIRLGRPVIFSQQRPGHKGHSFQIYKFRTMMRTTYVDGRVLSDDERIGRLGKVIRALSLDELPQMWNVLRGDMSLVGPRPLLMEYLPLYTPEQMRRHDMKPGLAGLAQVSGRNNVPWDQRFELDVWYVDNWSLWLDAKIALLTIRKVLTGDGVSAKGVATMTKFTGSEKAP